MKISVFTEISVCFLYNHPRTEEHWRQSSCQNPSHCIRFMMVGQKLLEVNGPKCNESNNASSICESWLLISGDCTLAIYKSAHDSERSLGKQVGLYCFESKLWVRSEVAIPELQKLSLHQASKLSLVTSKSSLSLYCSQSVIDSPKLWCNTSTWISSIQKVPWAAQKSFS